MPDHRSAAIDNSLRTSRRRILAGMGGGIAATFAGCGAVVEPSPTYQERTDVDVEGDERTAEEMTAAEAVAEQEVNEGVEALDALSFEDHEFVLQEDFRGPTVEGTVTNTGSDRIQLVELRTRVYNTEGNQLGRYLATTGDLEADTSWEFEVVLLEAPNDIASYELAALGAT